MDAVELDICGSVPLAFKEHSGGEHGVGHVYQLAEERFDEPVLPVLAIILEHADKNGTGDMPQVVGVVAVEARQPNSVGGKRVDSCEQPIFALGVRREWQSGLLSLACARSRLKGLAPGGTAGRRRNPGVRGGTLRFI